MKKIIALIVVVLLFLFAGYQCSKSLSRPVTNLEFWIGDNVENVDFSKYQERYGLMGGREYYGSGYIPSTNEYGEQADPEYCVIYTVTSYPDYSSNKQHITRISITDPSVEVYGLTFHSSLEDIEGKMRKEGFKIEYSAGGLIAKKGKFSFNFSENSINIRANVTNIFGIQF